MTSSDIKKNKWKVKLYIDLEKFSPANFTIWKLSGSLRKWRDGKSFIITLLQTEKLQGSKNVWRKKLWNLLFGGKIYVSN